LKTRNGIETLMLGRVLVRGEGPLGPRRLEVIQPLLTRVHSGLQLLGALQRRQPDIRRRDSPAGSSQHVSHPLRHVSKGAWLSAKEEEAACAGGAYLPEKGCRRVSARHTGQQCSPEAVAFARSSARHVSKGDFAFAHAERNHERAEHEHKDVSNVVFPPFTEDSLIFIAKRS
jgi:hypothetical protein